MSEHQFRGRREDLRLVTGRGRYTADHHFDGQVAGHFLRADRAHAKIVRIDIEEAKKLPGVLDILTGADLVAAGWKGAPAMAFFKGVGGSSLRVPFRTGLAHRSRALRRRAGRADCRRRRGAIAQDAAELIAVEYEDLPVVVTAGAALAAGATPLHDDAPEQSGVRLRVRQSRQHRARLQGRGACGPGRAARPAHLRQSDGAEVLHRALRRRGRCLRRLRSDPGHLRHEQHAVRHDRAARRKNSASVRTTSAAPSACATRSIPNSWRSCWRPSAPASR